MERCALDETEELELKKYVESKGLILYQHPFHAAAERLKKSLTYRPIKLTGECNNHPLIEHIASFGKPVILSTGMNTIESVTKR
jgi:N-acetylneuraminate synthase